MNSDVTAGYLIGTIGYSGNAAGLQKKNLPPHLHFAYFRTVTGIDGKVVSLARIKDSGEGIRAYNAKDAILALRAAKSWSSPRTSASRCECLRRWPWPNWLRRPAAW